MQALIQQALQALPAPEDWTLLPGHHLPRLQHRAEAILVTDRAILAFANTRANADAAAIDLADFHEGCRDLPVLPIALLTGQRVTLQRPLPLPGAAPAIACTRLLLPSLLQHVASFPSLPGFSPASWVEAPYRPVPGLIDAACRLYARHDVAHLLLATSTRNDLARTQAAVTAAIQAAKATETKTILFVTGLPGAGKTLCGLDLAFTPGHEATFLTGNPALLHVLRAALVRDAADRGLAARAARQRVCAVIQPLHHFRDHHVNSPTPPPDRLLVIDEAQRCWTAAYATRKTRHRPTPLHDSEPGVILDIMARHPGWCAIVCLVGGGQEIHAGEGGLAAWSQALATRPDWHPQAAPNVLTATDPRQQWNAGGSGGDGTSPPALNAALNLATPVRAHRAPSLIPWVEAMLNNNPQQARQLAGPGLPIRLTRSLPTLQRSLRAHPQHRSGLVASAGARRLRAEGLGGLLWHQDEDAVASWFLETWPDIRSADALELAATEFGIQGLELDHIGLCWDGDLVRSPTGDTWQARAFRATAWTVPNAQETLSNRLNAYRVLLTRARHSTAIWVPRGDPRDSTRDPARYDAIAAYLSACGLATLDATHPGADDAPLPHPSSTDLIMPPTSAPRLIP